MIHASISIQSFDADDEQPARTLITIRTIEGHDEEHLLFHSTLIDGAEITLHSDSTIALCEFRVG